MLGWFKRWRQPVQPIVRPTVLGEVACRSSVLLIADPMSFYDPIRVEGVPPGRHSVHASMIRYPEGGERIAKIAIRFRPGQGKVRKPLGSVGVDSGMAALIDENAYQQHWKEVGPERIGRTIGPKDHCRVAKLIGDKFGLRWREVDFLSAEFAEPISEELEERITAFLQTFSEYATYTFMYFSVKTRNSMDRVYEAMRDRSFAEVVLDDRGDARLLAMTAGFGDGRYAVEGQFDDGELVAVEVEFIGPDQDEVLKAFPILRY